MSEGVRLGVDIGGTFTDFTMVDSANGTVRVEKILTSTGAAERAVLQGVDRFREAQQDVLANLAKGPNGSSSLPVGNLLPVQPINFIQPNDQPAPQNSPSATTQAAVVLPAVILETPAPSHPSS